MTFYLLTVESTDGKKFQCIVKAHDELKAIEGFGKSFRATRNIKNIEIQNIRIITEDGHYLDISM